MNRSMLPNLINVENPPFSGWARLVRLLMDVSGESLAIAVVGQHESGEPFARPVTTKVLKCLPPDLGEACHAFGNLLVSDYLAWCTGGNAGKHWQSPLGGIEIGPAFRVDADSSQAVILTALEQCALFHRVQDALPRQKKSETTLRPIDESRFAQAVKQEVLACQPSLEDRFNRVFSLTGAGTGFPIDYIGHTYATCYAALNPKSKTPVRLKAASAALWRLARARDAFGFAAPERIELTAWVPAPGLPIYSDGEYEMVRDTIDELREQAKREQLYVFPAYDAHRASERLLKEEVLATN